MSFLKYAGGKSRQLPFLLKHLPQGERLVEPFVGSGAVFMGTDYDSYLLADSNADVINLYRHLREDGKRFIDYARQFFADSNSELIYYKYRDYFNAEPKTSELRSSLLIYLNRHGYNGLIRYNQDGGFNVPFGKYARVYFPEKEMLAFYRKLVERDTLLVEGDYKSTLSSLSLSRQLHRGDVVYNDPPYIPLSDGGFTAYDGNRFGWPEHVDLAQRCSDLGERGIHCAISNHANSEVNRLYKMRGAKTYFASAGRSISSKAHQRSSVREVLAVWGGG